ncbi:MAG: type II secretion system protein K [Porticoccaceae bacterium]|nr:MAG: type II secretion system protein K [Porticoccaceae bacterium]
MSGRREGGFALVAVLGVVAFAAAVAATLFYRQRLEMDRTAREMAATQALLAALGAEAWAARLLEEDVRAGGVDHLGERWAIPTPPLPAAGGRLWACLTDLQGRVPLNALGLYSAKAWADEEGEGEALRATPRRVVMRLFALLDLDVAPARLAALVDWIDADGWPLSAEGAEDGEYLGADPPHRAANRPLVELAELVEVRGFGAADVVRLAPWVNVLDERVAINVNTAPALVLAALTPRLDLAAAERLAQRRPFFSREAFYAALAEETGAPRRQLEEELPATLVGIASRYFELTVWLEFGSWRFRHHALLRRGEDGRTRVLLRGRESVPASPDAQVPPFPSCTAGGER